MDYENVTYDIDPALVVEADVRDIDRVEAAMADMMESADELGALFKPLVAKLPGSKRTEIVSAAQKLQGTKGRARGLLDRMLRRKAQRDAAIAVCRNTSVIAGSKPITRAELRGKVEVRGYLFADLVFKQGALSASLGAMGDGNKAKVFHKGINDPGSPYGVADHLNRHHTNLIEKGQLADGHIFVGHGCEILPLPTDGAEPTSADLRVFGDALVDWGDRNGNRAVTLGRVSDMVPQSGVLVASVGGAAPVGLTYGGKPFWQKKPLFTLRGGEAGQEMRLVFPNPALEITKEYRVRIKMTGRYFQPAGGVVS